MQNGALKMPHFETGCSQVGVFEMGTTIAFEHTQ